MAIHRLITRVLYVRNDFQNKNVPVKEIFFITPYPYYLDLSDKSYPNFPLNRDNGSLCLKRINRMQVTKSTGQQLNRLLYDVVKILAYNKVTINHDIYVKLFFIGVVSYLTVSTNGVFSTNNYNELF